MHCHYHIYYSLHYHNKHQASPLPKPPPTIRSPLDSGGGSYLDGDDEWQGSGQTWYISDSSVYIKLFGGGSGDIDLERWVRSFVVEPGSNMVVVKNGEWQQFDF